jgi:Fe2+ or Zn2+ uptake regulation protein
VYAAAMEVASKNLLNNLGLKATPGRIRLLALLQKTTTPLTIQDMLKGLSQSMDQATLYRNLEALTAANLVRQLEFKKGKAYYELSDRHDHHHIVCRDCGQIEDFVGCDFDKLAAKALKQSRKFSAIKEHSFEMFGICDSCTVKN